MSRTARSFKCLKCRLEVSNKSPKRLYHASTRLGAEAPRHSIAPKVSIDIKHIRSNEALYKQNCIERNYRSQAIYPARIKSLHEEWQGYQRDARSLRER